VAGLPPYSGGQPSRVFREYHESGNGYLLHDEEFRRGLLLQFEKSCQSLLLGEVDLYQLGILLRPLVVLASCLASNNSIMVHIGSLSTGDAFEISVPGFGNYFIGDVLHANCGKTQTLLYEAAIHLTGMYPDDWKGIRYNRPVEMWIVGVTTEKVRDNLQKALLGDVGSFGTGYIPKSCLDLENGCFTKKPGIPDAIQKARINHVSGSKSSVQFFSYEQPREYFQSSTIDIVLFDEEPPEAINNECRIRVMVKGGYMMYAFTPLSTNPVVCRGLMEDEKASIFSISMDDVPWISDEIRDEMLKGCSEMEARARRHGIPASGGGTIFEFDKSEYCCKSFDIPDHWHRLGGIDIGFNHPTGAIALAVDRGTDRVFVYQEYKAKEKSAVEVARNLRHWGVHFAGSHDAFNKNFQTGGSTADVFEKESLHMFSAGRDDWARIEKVRSMIADGRLWIFEDICPELIRQLQIFHTVTTSEGKLKIYKHDDDMVDAFTHAVANYEKASPKGTYGRRTAHYTIKQWNPVDQRYGI
jgi:phage terminase large subunit-like protein